MAGGSRRSGSKAYRSLRRLALRKASRRLGRSSSTINRVLARNRLLPGGYQPRFAAGSYLARSERLALLKRDERLEHFVIDRLTEGWKPEQFAARIVSLDVV